ncbi:MAG TPA: hypothetical protein VLG44_08540 [Chlamydiales bacterium]|nr:hypothetical protein [Chlamydiales bacterium]
MTRIPGYNYPSRVCVLPIIGYFLIEARIKTLSDKLEKLLKEKGLIACTYPSSMNRIYQLPPTIFNSLEKREIVNLLTEKVDRLICESESIGTSGAAIMLLPIGFAFKIASNYSFVPRVIAFWVGIVYFFGGLSPIRSSGLKSPHLTSTQTALNNFQNDLPTEIEVYN